MPANSFATFFKAVYPTTDKVLDDAGTYGDPVNVLVGLVPPATGGGDATLANQLSMISKIDSIIAELPNNFNLLAINGSGEVTTSVDLSGVELKIDNLQVTCDAILDDTANVLDGKLNTITTNLASTSTHNANDVAAAILINPANPLLTNGTGQVETSNVSSLDPVELRDAIGMANANMDVQLGALSSDIADVATGVEDIIPHGDTNWASVAGSGDAPYRYKVY